jgi:hypothetical protein
MCVYGQPDNDSRQVSWAGWGWSLAGLGQITQQDGNYFLSLNGTSDRLYQQIGQLKVELDWLKKKSGYDA